MVEAGPDQGLSLVIVKQREEERLDGDFFRHRSGDQGCRGDSRTNRGSGGGG